MKKIIIIGGYGNGTVAASTIIDINRVKNEWEIIGFLNDFEKAVNGFPVVGKITFEDAQNFVKDENIYFIYTLITPVFRHNDLNKLLDLKIPKNRFATIIHPTAVISEFSKIGNGVSIQPFVSVGPNVIIHNHVQVFAQALVGHDATIKDYSYVANNSCIGAKVVLEKGSYLGTNCSTIENITIGEWGFVGMGAVVINDVEPYAKVVGNPARKIGTVK